MSLILGTFCEELIKLNKRFKPIYHRLHKSIVAVLNYHIEIARMFFKNMDKHCSAESKAYWGSCADPDLNDQKKRRSTKSFDWKCNNGGRTKGSRELGNLLPWKKASPPMHFVQEQNRGDLSKELQDF